MSFHYTPDPKDPGKKRKVGYKGYIAYVDVIVGRILNALEKAGLSDNTLVIFVSDNGSYGVRGKNSSTETGAWVPMIFTGAGVKKRGMVDEMAIALSLTEEQIDPARPNKLKQGLGLPRSNRTGKD